MSCDTGSLDWSFGFRAWRRYSRYHYIDGLSWIDSLLNASMIVGGMVPVDSLRTNAAKVFAACYALFSGLAFIGIVSVLLAPFVRRMLHRFDGEEQG